MKHSMENNFIQNKAEHVTSRLYHLMPIGIGTENVESLTSYFARLAEAHCVTPGLLAAQCEPLLGKNYDIGGSGRLVFQSNLKKLNGFSPDAHKIVEVLEYLTLFKNLRFLTMITWSNIISNSRMYKDFLAWCPYCYEEWRNLGQAIYNPLIWHFSIVSVCSKHKINLVSECPKCNDRIPVLGRKSRVGYCSRCGTWLGQYDVDSEICCTIEEENTTQEWIINFIGKLLKIAPCLSQVPQREFMSSFFEGIISAFTAGGESKSELARRLNIGAAALGSWEHGHFIPQLDYLLRVCYGLDIDFAEIVLGKQEVKKVRIPETSKYLFSERVNIEKLDQMKIKKLLNDLLKEEQVPSIYKITQSTGYRAKIIKSNFPHEYNKIVLKHREYKKRKSMEEKSILHNKIRGCVIELIEEGTYPTLKAVREQLSKNCFYGDNENIEVWRRALRESGL